MKSRVLFVIMLTCSVLDVFGQQIQTLNLQQTIEMAMEKNTSIIQSQTNVDAASGRVLAAYGSYLPTASVGAGWGRTQVDQQAGTRVVNGQIQTYDALFKVENNFSSGISLNYTIFDGLNREAGFNSAQSNALSSEDKALRMRQSITNQVENAYLNILRLEQLVRVTEENVKRDDRQLERITESNKVGAVALADVYRQQSQVAADELLQINAQNNFDQAKADLAALVGLDMGMEYRFADPSIAVIINDAEMDSSRRIYSDQKQLNARAIAARPDYLAAKEDFSAAQAGVTQARSGYFPTISASAGFNLQNTEFRTLAENKNVNWGVNLRWNIFDAFRTNEALQAAMASERTSETSLSQAERNISVQVKKALLDLEAARKQIEVSQKGLVSATQDHKIAEERYNLGAGTLLDLLTANAGLVNAQANNVNATFNYNIAKRNVEYVIGERVY